MTTRKNQLTIIFLVLLGILILTTPSHVWAQGSLSGGSGKSIVIAGIAIPIPDGYQIGGRSTIDALVEFVIRLLFYIGLALSLIFLIIGGIRWITGGGNKEASASAKGTVSSAIIGLVLLIGSFLILNVVQHIFGLKLGLP